MKNRAGVNVLKYYIINGVPKGSNNNSILHRVYPNWKGRYISYLRVIENKTFSIRLYKKIYEK